MKQNRVILLFVLLSSFAFSCQTVPITGREQLSFVPASQILPLSFNQYQDFLAKHKVVEHGEQAELVKRVGMRIEHAVERYFSEHGLSSRLTGYQWEFHLVDDKEVNAWCMPGGKVVVYSGILPITKDENGLAVVLGHEIAHAAARHGGERMTEAMALQYGGQAVGAFSSKDPKWQAGIQTAYGAVSQVGLELPHSRLTESEADHIGLIYMARAGYNPEAAVAFWQRFAEFNKQAGGSTPWFLRTHPMDDKRIERLKGWMAEAKAQYRPQR